MTAVLADTHAALWYLQAAPQLSRPADAAMAEAVESGSGLLVSAISLVEAVYLTEKGRLSAAAWQQLTAVLADPAIPLTVLPVDQQVALALRHVPREQVPDMPDRIITATALAYRLPLVTRDGTIRTAGVVATIW